MFVWRSEVSVLKCHFCINPFCEKIEVYVKLSQWYASLQNDEDAERMLQKGAVAAGNEEIIKQVVFLAFLWIHPQGFVNFKWGTYLGNNHGKNYFRELNFSTGIYWITTITMMIEMIVNSLHWKAITTLGVLCAHSSNTKVAMKEMTSSSNTWCICLYRVIQNGSVFNINCVLIFNQCSILARGHWNYTRPRFYLIRKCNRAMMYSRRGYTGV